MQAALYAVGQAELTAQACGTFVKRTRRATPPGRVPAPPAVGVSGSDWGLGIVTPDDVLSYRTTWNQYVLDTIGSADACASAYSALSAQQMDASTKALLSGLSDAIQKQADALNALWNIYANKSASFIVLQGASMLQSFQDTVLSAGQVRENITTGTLSCSLSYVNSQGQFVQATPAANPSVQAQVISRIEGLGILAQGVLQILVEGTGNALVAAGDAAQELAKEAGKVVSTFTTPWPSIAITAAAAGYVIYEVWPKGRS